MRSRVVRAKKRAKVLLFFDMTKYFLKKNQKKMHFAWFMWHFDRLSSLGSGNLSYLLWARRSSALRCPAECPVRATSDCAFMALFARFIAKKCGKSQKNAVK